jgi:hypothetical protein
MGNTAVMLAVIGGILSSIPRQEGILILAQPVPEDARLQPTWVELEHRYLGPDDSTWVTEIAPVFLLSVQFDDAMRGWSEDGVLHAPVPLTYDQALVLIPGTAVGEIEGARWVLVLLDDCTFTYHFDDAGRTVRVEMDPTADSAVYWFSYGYDACPDSAAETEPSWIDDLTPPRD